jgi:hypothetical protein
MYKNENIRESYLEASANHKRPNLATTWVRTEGDSIRERLNRVDEATMEILTFNFREKV